MSALLATSCWLSPPPTARQGRRATTRAKSESPNPNTPTQVAAKALQRVAKGLSAALLAGIITFHPNISASEAAELKALNAYACEDTSIYYKPAAGLTGPALKRALHEIIKDHKVFTYDQAWAALGLLDAGDEANPTTSPNVLEIYSRRQAPKSLQGNPQGWNREHLWPRSFGLHQKEPNFSDLYNLRPADVNVNSSRGNKFYDECQVGVNQCIQPANIEAAADTTADTYSWAPPIEVRGDIARSMFYMATRYDGSEGPEALDLELSEVPNPSRGRFGRLSTLLKWHAEDPVDEHERMRNERVCRLFQHNRNPFIDHPEFVTQIDWKSAPMVDPKPIPYKPTSPEPPVIEQPNNNSSNKPNMLNMTGLAVDPWINEFHYDNVGADENEFVEVAVPSGVDPSNVTVYLYNGSDGTAYKTLRLNSAPFTKQQSVGNVVMYSAVLGTNTIQNGSPDGIAISVKNAASERLVQFLSYEGVFAGSGGVAGGIKSVDIGVEENNDTPKGKSLGLVGRGSAYSDFRWKAMVASPGAQNAEQQIVMKN
eukprot:jgi/Chlat1/8836/Chrsp91S09255